jgi:WD40 repeat protein
MFARRALLIVVLCAGAEPHVDRHGDPLPAGAIARLGTVRFRHAGRAVALAYSPDGKTLAAAGGDCSLVFWDAESGQERCRADGFYLRVEYLEGGAFLAALGADSVVILDPITGEVLNTVAAVERWFCLAATPDRQSFAVGAHGTIRVFDAETGQQTKEIPAHRGRILALAIDPNGDQLALANDDERDAILWDIRTNEEVRRFTGSGSAITSLAFLPDGKTLVVVPMHGPVCCYDVQTGKLRARLSEPNTSWSTMAITRDGTIAAITGSSRVSLYSTESGRELARITGVHSAMEAMRFSPDGKTLAINEGHVIRRFDVATQKDLDTPESHRASELSAAWSPDSRHVVSVGNDGSMRFWDAATGRRFFCSHQESVIERVAFSPDGKSVIGVAWGAAEPIRLFDFPAGRERLRFGGKEQPLIPRSISFAPDGKTVATDDSDTTIARWDAATGEPLQSIRTDRDPFLPGDDKRVITTACHSPDGRHLAALVWYWRAGLLCDARLRVWDTVSGDELPALDGQESPGLGWEMNTRLVFTPDGRTVAALDASGSIHLWETATGQTRRTIQLEKGRRTGVTISADGRHLAAAVDMVVHVWDITTGREVRRLHGHTGRLYGLAFSPDGRRLLTWSSDMTALVWDVADLMNLNN